MQTLYLEIHGMTGLGCAADVQRVIARLDGVAYVVVCQRTNRAAVLADLGCVTPAQIESAIDRLGYEARVRQFERLDRATP